MAYASKHGRRPMEYASKAGHLNIIKEKTVQDFLARCDSPKKASDICLYEKNVFNIKPLEANPIKIIIAIDGGYTETSIQQDFPSSSITFFNFGAVIFKREDLDDLKDIPFIDPEDISKLKKIGRYYFVLPTKNISLEGNSFMHSVRKSFFEFFNKELNGDRPLIDSLRWLIFEEYQKKKRETWNLASCPNCFTKNIDVRRSYPNEFPCPNCGQQIYMTDIFRFHEVVDEEMGAGGIISYTMNLLEQILLVHLIKSILELKPSLLGEVLFIKDGPLAFFGQTANLQKPMRKLTNFLFSLGPFYLVGIEKSGSFVDHAKELENKLEKNKVLILNDKYIYNFIIPGKADPSKPYGSTTYYGNKVIYKTDSEYIYVLTIPSTEITSSPDLTHFPGFNTILQNVSKLKCDMYDDSLIPIALVNKLVSLSQHPSKSILEYFVKRNIKK